MSEKKTNNKGRRPPFTARAGRAWRRHSWLFIGLLWIVAVVLGCIGFMLNAPAEGRSDSFLDVAYRTLLLIPMSSGDVDNASWPLNVARFLLPFLTAWTAIRALMGLFRDRWQQALVRFWRGHVIICGLSRKGWLLAQGFVERGDRVVVLEADKAHGLIGSCRERGITILIGDATDRELLGTAGLLHAHHLVAVTDDDGVNAEIAVRTQEMLRQSAADGDRRNRPLTCTVHLVDPQLYMLARTSELALEENVPLRLELFNVFERGARLLWSEYGPARNGDGAAPVADPPAARCASHIVVIGLGRLGESLAVHAARDWYTRMHKSQNNAAGRLAITVVDQGADLKCRALSTRYPQLEDACDLLPLTVNARSPEFYQGAFLAGSAERPPVSAVFVCFDDDSLGLTTGLAVQQRLLRLCSGPVPVVVRMAEAGGLARLVAPYNEGRPAPVSATLHAFSLLDHTCTPEAILGGTHEVLARGLHEVYVQQQQALGHTAAANPSLAEWDQLPEALRESNRAQAGGIYRNLAALGYTLIPLVDWDAAFFRLSESEVERLAEREHNRFVAERQNEGWRYADGPKDIDARLSPTLVPWDQLPDDERTKTGATMRELPATLARAGFQIVSLAGPSQAAATSPIAATGQPTTAAPATKV